MPKKEDDLSEYEKIRLANINRNAEFLLSIGCSAIGRSAPSTVTGSRKKLV
jgi:hypothetical protein